MATTLPNDVVDRIKNASAKGRTYFDSEKIILEGTPTDDQVKTIGGNVLSMVNQDKNITPADRISFLEQEWRPILQRVVNQTSNADQNAKTRATRYAGSINNLIANLRKQTPGQPSTSQQPQQGQTKQQPQEKKQKTTLSYCTG